MGQQKQFYDSAKGQEAYKKRGRQGAATCMYEEVRWLGAVLRERQGVA